MLVVPGIVRTPFRRHVLAGEAPEGVMRIRHMISPEALAAAVVSGIERKRRRVLLPWPGYVFAALNALFPSIIDWYCDRKLAGRAAGSRAARRVPASPFRQSAIAATAPLHWSGRRHVPAPPACATASSWGTSW